jgi:hypothetical protein
MPCKTFWWHILFQNAILKEINNLLASNNLLCCSTFYTVFELIIGVIFVYVDQRPCDKPLRLWLLIHLIGECVHLMTRLHKSKNQEKNWPHLVLRMHYVFSFLWLTFGCYMFYGIVNCDAKLIRGLLIFIIMIDYLLSAIPIISILLTLFNFRFLMEIIEYFNGQYDWFDELKTLKLLKYNEDIFNPDRRRCCVCLKGYENGEWIRLLKCSHDYHRECVDLYLGYKGCCPICGMDLIQFHVDERV